MFCEGWNSQQLLRRLQNEHRLQQQHQRGSDGTSSFDYSVTSSSSERSSNSYKTSLCAEFKATQYCSFGNACRYAHTYDELQLAKPRGKCNPKYKTKVCDKFSSTGYCKYGEKCQYIHDLLNPTIRKQRERRGVAMHINERPLESYRRQGRHGGGLNARMNVAVDQRMNVTMDERMNVSVDQRMNVTMDERMNVAVDQRMNVTVDGFAGRLEEYSNVDEKWTPFSKKMWGFQIEEQLNTSLPMLRPSIDPVSIVAFNSLLFDESIKNIKH